MINRDIAELKSLLSAVAFAGRAHHGQLRKDGKTPYSSHVFRVCLILRDFLGVIDADTVTAALLHDTIEDTTTDFDDIEESWGTTVGGIVAALTKDSRLPEQEREAVYEATICASSWQVRVCKIADVIDNLLDSESLPPGNRLKTLSKTRRWIEVLSVGSEPVIVDAIKKLSQLRAEIESDPALSSRA
jgi:guanosine-3',5'-bis(diphosphate) 3'-pyrophosphohydrolase